MANNPVTITYNNGSPRFNPPPGTPNLDPNDTVTVQASGFPSGSNINEVDFYHNKTVNGVDQKDTSNPAGKWTSANGNSNDLTAYSVTADSATKVVITDVEHPQNADKYWYSVRGLVGGSNSPWSVDPELINKSG